MSPQGGRVLCDTKVNFMQQHVTAEILLQDEKKRNLMHQPKVLSTDKYLAVMQLKVCKALKRFELWMPFGAGQVGRSNEIF